MEKKSVIQYADHDEAERNQHDLIKVDHVIVALADERDEALALLRSVAQYLRDSQHGLDEYAIHAFLARVQP